MAEFDFEQTVQVNGTPDEVWSLITDVPRLVGWISVLHDATTVEELAHYRAVMQDKVGMFKLKADLDIRVTEKTEGQRIVVHAEGEDRQVGSRIVIDATVTMSPGESATGVTVAGRYGISGSAATLGSSTIRRKGDKIVQEFFTNLGKDAA
ncbi:CoxG family protein [Nocardioides soli]|uniref:Carbon monoxide dehydrogenase subunit G n=1 Tax=Nocardioides soli TaxID=1036020 RepID=A0A7W4Z0S2_9ACTN|nr:SRPBCC domain-containing protein [Nocardioides soli]MBB3042604.1 carbon monoxide dehydrogenase subunit G [Nocardioides soli]